MGNGKELKETPMKMTTNLALQEALCVFNALRSVGFASEQIFIIVAQVAHKFDGDHCFVELRMPDKIFKIDCGPILCDANGFLTHMQETVNGIQSGRIADAELNAIWVKSIIRRQLPMMLMEMVRRGFPVRNPLAN